MKPNFKTTASRQNAAGRSAPVPGRSDDLAPDGMKASGALDGFTWLRPGRAHSERGIALVITLILLSVTLFMAVAFLAISRRERDSVLTETDTVTARLAADSALANAEAQILATVLQTTNPYNFNLLVSTNYINAYGFVTGVANPTNVNYDFYNGGAQPLNGNDYLQNIANLFLSPRPPVFVYDRTTGTTDFRFYLDLNRNGQYDANGLVGNVDNFGVTNGTTPFVSEVGDPEWIGVLERPDAPHGPNNKFLARYAFVAMPAGNTLDLNAIHNQVFNQGLGTADGYFRNQGVGSWEINLAAFLADLNTNEWNNTVSPYNYSRWSGFNNAGVAFDDARALLAYRYNWSYSTLADFSAQFANVPTVGGPVDVFPFGTPPMNTAAVPFYNPSLNTLWAGSDNTNHYFELASDLFNPAKTEMGVTAPGFIERLLQTGTNFFGGTAVSTYNRYTFYRLLSQLGTDSTPETGKLNVNYVNVDNTGTIVPGLQTNLVAWTPVNFFTNAADRMLRAYTTQWFQSNPSNYLAAYYGITNYNYYHFDASGNRITNDIYGVGLTNVPFFGMTNQIPAFGVANIPVLVNSNFVYQPAVQRILQLAANIYDATTNKAAALGKDYPSVFRPVFARNGLANLFVSGYVEVSSLSMFDTSATLDLPHDAGDPLLATNAALTALNGNVYGVPWIIGAKRGFPNFNKFSLESVVSVTRKLLLTRTNNPSLASTVPGLGGIPMMLTGTNQMYVFSITNYLGIEFWNSYSNAYTNAAITVRDSITTMLTNPVLTMAWIPATYALNIATNVPVWPGWSTNGTQVASSFVLPWTAGGTNQPFLSASVYQFGNEGFVPVDSNPNYEPGVLANLPHFGLTVTNRLQVFMLDNGHVIDYAHFNGPNSARDLNTELADPPYASSQTYQWSTNLYNSSVPWGVLNQISVSAGSGNLAVPENGPGWATPPGLPKELIGQTGAIEAYFHGFLSLSSLYTSGGNVYTNSDYVVQAPYTPTRVLVNYTSWQANDPLVHYLASDLNYSGQVSSLGNALQTGTNQFNPTLPPVLPGLGLLNQRYQPWGQAHLVPGTDGNPYNSTYRDPLVTQSDGWAFPSYKLPTVGWLGRVHRGTPWQTVYLKATNVVAASGIATWTNWTGNPSLFDATNSAPVQDRLLFDIFTTALNDNATRGQLPINVAAGDTNNPAAGLAAWSAVFSGLAVPTSLTNTYQIINPAGVVLTNSPLYALVTNINYLRSRTTNGLSQGGAFEHVGDILSVPQLTQASPFLAGRNITNGISDALMEWLPQQTLSLLRVSSQPRFVIYSYGQTLAAAPNGVVNSGAYAGMITNYQVTAETVTRSVIRIEGAPTNTHAVVESSNVLPPD